MADPISTALLYLLLFVQVNANAGVTNFSHIWIIHDAILPQTSTLVNPVHNQYPTTHAVSNEESTLGELGLNDNIIDYATISNTGDPPKDYSGYYKAVLKTISHIRFGMSVAGIIGNTVNAVVCLQSNFRHLPVTPYMVALAVFDNIGLYNSAFVVGWKKYTGQTVPDLSQMCNVRRYFNLVSLCTSAMLLCAISLQRMIAIRYPLHAKLWLKKSGIYCSLVVIIVYATASFSPVIFAFTTQCHMKSEWARMYTFNVLTYQLLICNNLLPDAILVITNALLIISIKDTIFRKGTGNTVHGNNEKNVKKCTIMAVTLAVAHLLLTTPLAVHSILDALDVYDTRRTEKLTSYLVYLLYTTNHAINFFLCVATSSSFRRSLKTLLSCQVCRRRRPRENTNSSATVSTSMAQTDVNRQIG